MIKTKYRVWFLVWPVAFAALVIFVWALAVIRNTKLADKPLLMLFYSLGYCLYGLIAFLVRSPRIMLDEGGVRLSYVLGWYRYNWSEVEDVELHECRSYLPFSRYGQSMKLFFTGDRSVTIFDVAYKDMSLLRRFVTEKLNDRLQFLKPKKYDFQTKFESKKYAGNPVFCQQTISLWTIAALGFVLLPRAHPLKPLYFLFFLPLIGLYLIVGSQMNYFVVRDRSLWVYNHFFWWRKKQFYAEDIREMFIEPSRYRQATALTIMTNDFALKSYGAGSLRKKHWEALSMLEIIYK